MPDNLRYMYAEDNGKKIVVGARRLADDFVEGVAAERWDISFLGSEIQHLYSPVLPCVFEPGTFRLIGEVPLIHETTVVADEAGAWSAGTLLDALSRIVEDAVVDGADLGAHVPGKTGTIGEIRDSAVEDILRALGAAKVHNGSTLAEVVAETEHFKSLIRSAQKPPEGGWQLTVRDGQVPVLARLIFEACWGPDYLMDKTLLQGPLERGVPDILQIVQSHAKLNGVWPIEHCYEAINFAEIENQALRRNLVWLAGQDCTTPAVRRELSARIRDLHGPGCVPENSAEEEEAELRHYARIADNVCDLVQEIIDWRESRRQDEAEERRPRMYWDSQADSAIRALREFTPKKFSGTLAGVREVRNGK